MELENLRTIWRVTMERPAAAVTDEEIRALLSRRSRGLVAKMKRNLFGEGILVLAIYSPAVLFYFFGSKGRDAELGGVLLLLIAFFAGYYYRKNRLLNDMQCPEAGIRSRLDRQVTILRRYVRFYTIAGTILVPVMAIAAFWVSSRNLRPGEAGFLTGAFEWKELWMGAAALAAVTVVSYYTNAWAMNRLYGRHIKRLRQLLEEMDEA